MTLSLPRFVAIGEALTDMICLGGDQWISKTGGSTWNVARAVAAQQPVQAAPVQAAPVAAAPEAVDPLAQLERLANLAEKGLLSAEEFAAAKKLVLGL